MMQETRFKMNLRWILGKMSKNLHESLLWNHRSSGRWKATKTGWKSNPIFIKKKEQMSEANQLQDNGKSVTWWGHSDRDTPVVEKMEFSCSWLIYLLLHSNYARHVLTSSWSHSACIFVLVWCFLPVSCSKFRCSNKTLSSGDWCIFLLLYSHKALKIRLCLLCCWCSLLAVVLPVAVICIYLTSKACVWHWCVLSLCH